MTPVFIEFEVDGVATGDYEEKDGILQKAKTQKKMFRVSEIIEISEYKEGLTVIGLKAPHTVKTYHVVGNYEDVKNKIGDAYRA